MIRAEDYVNQLDGCGIGHDKRCSCDRCFRGKKIALLPEDIKAIQLEAWKQGMTDAATVAEDMADKYSMSTKDNSFKWPCERVADNIEMRRDRKTEL